jgi:hypothetical protein
LWGIGGKANAPFNIVSIQFAIHYLFEKKSQLDGLITNISENLKPGGYLIGTCFDGSKIYKELFDKKKGETIDGKNKNSILWRIEKQYDNFQTGNDLPSDSSSLGLPINVYLSSINNSFVEYLVNFEYLKEILKAANILILQEMSFEDIYDDNNQKKAFKTIVGDLSEDEKKISFMYKTFIFKKSSADDIIFDEIYKTVELNKDAFRKIIKTQQWAELKRLIEQYNKNKSYDQTIFDKVVEKIKKNKKTLIPPIARAKKETSVEVKAKVMKKDEKLTEAASWKISFNKTKAKDIKIRRTLQELIDNYKEDYNHPELFAELQKNFEWKVSYDTYRNLMRIDDISAIKAMKKDLEKISQAYSDNQITWFTTEKQKLDDTLATVKSYTG